MSERSREIRTLFSSIAARYDLANRILSCGMDVLWRKRAARRVRAWGGGGVLLDLATGTGDLARAIGRACPGALVLAIDYCVPLLRRAATKRVVNLVAADGLKLPLADASVDGVAVAFGLRNMESWEGAIREVARVLRAGGRFLILEFSMPDRPLRGFYRAYLHRALPTLAGLVTGRRDAYDYLARSIELFPRGDALCRMLRAHGFAEANHARWTLGVVGVYEAVKGRDEEPGRPGSPWRMVGDKPNSVRPTLSPDATIISLTPPGGGAPV